MASPGMEFLSLSLLSLQDRHCTEYIYIFDKMSLSEKLSQRDVCLRPVLGNVIRNKYIYWVSQKVIEVFHKMFRKNPNALSANLTPNPSMTLTRILCCPSELLGLSCYQMLVVCVEFIGLN